MVGPIGHGFCRAEATSAFDRLFCTKATSPISSPIFSYRGVLAMGSVSIETGYRDLPGRLD